MPESGSHSLDDEKRRLRAVAAARRDEAGDAETRMRAAEALAERIVSRVERPAGCPVSAYWPMGSEIDPRPAMTRLFGEGHPIGLPVIPGRRQPLVFRAWRPGQVLEPGGFGTSRPAADQPVVVPRLLLVPLLAFDRAGYRLGYGGGFYDRTLATLRAQGPVTAVGVAFAVQEVPAVPRDETDERLDLVVTEAEVIPCS